VLRISDHQNGPGVDEAATVVDIPFPATIPCVRSWKVAIGGTCSGATSANAIVPGSIQSFKRAVFELDQIQVFDGGSDAVASTTSDNTLFENQGLFAP
jgi:hypothetical protein